MSEQNNVLQLKKLAAKMSGTTVDKISGCTIADVLDYIQSKYANGGGSNVTISNMVLNVNGDYAVKNGTITLSDGQTIDIDIKLIDMLTLTASEGSAVGKTVIAITPKLTTGNHYRYTTSIDVLPAKGEDLTAWTAWNGVDELNVQNGKEIFIAECDSNDKAVKCGSCKAVSPIF